MSTSLSCQAPDIADRLAVICMVPDPGHLTPLLKLAARARHACDVLVLVPDELVDLAASYGFRVSGLGPVRPEAGLSDLHRYINSSEWARITSTLSAYQRSYNEPLAQGIERSLGRLHERLLALRPTCALADDHMTPPKVRKMLNECGCVAYFHATSPNYRRHNTWSLRSCYWTDASVALRDAIDKTRNEARLCFRSGAARIWRANSTAADGVVPPAYAASEAIGHISTGTSLLQQTLLNRYLLYAGEGRIVLPAIPPVEAALPQDLQGWLDESRSADIVYVSFGTMVRPSAETVMNIVEALSRRGRRVLLQYNGAFPAAPGVRHERWVPQAAVLSHPAVSLFVTHGGAASVEESLWAGKPMLCIPNVWDHYYYSWIVGLLGAGIRFPRRSLGSPRRLSAAIGRAFRQEYADSARSLSRIMHEQWAANQEAVIDLFCSRRRIEGPVA